MDYKLIQSSDPEAHTIIVKAYILKQRVKIWTTHGDSIEQLHDAIIINILKDNHLIVETKKPIDLIAGTYIGFGLESDSFYMQALVYKKINCQIKIQIPPLKTEYDRRRHKRHRPKKKEEAKINTPNTTGDILTSVYDKSEKGISIILSQQSLTLLLKGSNNRLSIKTSSVSKSCILKSIRVYTNATISQQTMFLVGLEFLDINNS